MAESVVGPWAKDKLDRLGKYLHAYTTIMKNQRWCEGYHYIDAFAGPGEHEIRQPKTGKRHESQQALLEVSSYGNKQEEQRLFLAGSPRVALDLQHPFTHYVFVERSSRLRTLFSHVSKAALIRNTRGGHLYYLMLASHNSTAVRIAGEILSAGEIV